MVEVSLKENRHCMISLRAWQLTTCIYPNPQLGVYCITGKRARETPPTSTPTPTPSASVVGPFQVSSVVPPRTRTGGRTARMQTWALPVFVCVFSCVLYCQGGFLVTPCMQLQETIWQNRAAARTLEEQQQYLHKLMKSLPAQYKF